MAKGSKRVALVTGASAGIGKAIVRRLLADGWTVYGAARRLEQMDDIKAAGARVVSLDVTDDASMMAAVKAVTDGEGRLDALVNNAGYGSYGAIEDVPVSEARRQFEVNVFGLARLCQLALPAMRAARSGTIVNISSMGGRIWMPTGGWYHATKHALEVLSDTLRVEVRPFGVHVVVVQPGAIESEWSGIAAKSLRESSANSVYGAFIAPMARILESYKSAARPEVVADAVSAAVNSANPRRRYAVPFQSKLYIFAHWLFPDWVWERVVAASVK
jgi:NAD(P)-dependent dehydrogenase (short-subunit alcohol dehydrogenase family)